MGFTNWKFGFRLKQWSVLGPSNFIDHDSVNLSEHCLLLKSLGLRLCGKITPSGLFAVAKRYGQQLRSIFVSGSHEIGEEGIASLGGYCGFGLEFLCGQVAFHYSRWCWSCISKGNGKHLKMSTFRRTLGLIVWALCMQYRNCSGPKLEILIIHNVGGNDCQYEVWRVLEGDMKNMSTSRLGLREKCQNVIFVLEGDCWSPANHGHVRSVKGWIASDALKTADSLQWIRGSRRENDGRTGW